MLSRAINSLSQKLNEFRSGRDVRAAIVEGIFLERHELRRGSSLDVSLIHDFTGGRAQNNVQAQVTRIVDDRRPDVLSEPDSFRGLSGCGT